MVNKFNVVYTGLQEGISAEHFISKFGSKFGISEQKAQQIVNSNSDVILKKQQGEKKAAQYRAAFESCGMIVRLDEIIEEAEVTSGLSLAPMGDEVINEDAAANINAVINTNAIEANKPRCPKCDSDQIKGDECQACGIYISKYLQSRKNVSITQDEAVIDDEPTEQFDARTINNPYETPEAPLEQSSVSKDGQGSLQGGLNGDYDFTIGDIYSESWEKIKGVKGTFLLAWGIYMLIAFSISFVFYFIPFDSQSIIESLVSIPALYPVIAGITLNLKNAVAHATT
ncbi:MAG: hypothetical protein KZQ57_09050 [gamma proteobacterium symbiont of Lucinoma myriamae]|nr:hypothetical protein [gamma proteobacterium symbiont of Lucinoma myriamae]